MSPVGNGWDLPPGSEPWTNFHWFQPSVSGVLVLVVLSERPTWYTGHYYERRMCPCLGVGCRLCASGIGAQVRYCFAVAERSTRRVGLIELGRGNGLLVRDWAYSRGEMRGLMIEVSKHSRSPQSRTEVQRVHEDAPLWSVGILEPDPSLALYLTWHKAGLPMPQKFEEEMSRACLLKADPVG